MRMIVLLVLTVFIAGCERPLISEDEAKKVITTIGKGCMYGGYEAWRKKKSVGVISKDKFDLAHLSVGDNEVTLLVTTRDPIGCIMRVTGTDQKTAINAFYTLNAGGIVVMSISGVPFTCTLGSKNRKSFYCSARTLVFTPKRVEEVREGVCGELMNYLQQNGLNIPKCMEVL